MRRLARERSRIKKPADNPDVDGGGGERSFAGTMEYG
jgi:hypothetical protein